MRVLITGVLGFIGHNLAKRLIADGHDVVGCDNLLTGSIENRLGNMTFLQCGVETFEYEAVSKSVDRRFDVVFHLAALPRVPVSFENPKLSLSNNLNSTIAALELARACGAVVVYSSSSSIYGDQPRMPLVEDMPKKPTSPYGLSKWIGEELCEQYQGAFGVRYAALRYFNVYGPGMTRGGYATAIRTFLDQQKRGEPITVTGDGQQERDFTHVTDVVDANVAAAEYLLECKRLNVFPEANAFNIGAGNPQKLLDIAVAIAGTPANIDFIPARREPKRTHADWTLAGRVLGWCPRADFAPSLNQLINENV